MVRNNHWSPPKLFESGSPSKLVCTFQDVVVKPCQISGHHLYHNGGGDGIGDGDSDADADYFIYFTSEPWPV